MATISLCSTSVANTGAIQCDVAPGKPKKFFVWNGSKAISTITGSAFLTFLEASSKKSKADSDKVFVFPVIQDIADNTEANTTGSLNQGFSTVLREGRPAYTFKVFSGNSLTKRLRRFNNQTINILMLDDNNRVWGVKSGDNFVGAQAKIFVGGNKFATGQNVEEGVVDISVSYLDETELNDNGVFGEISSYSGIIGLFDVDLAETAASASNVYKIGATIESGEIGAPINLYDSYADELANAALWTAYSGATYSTPLTITSVAKDTVNSGWTVTFDSTAFSALSSGASIKVNLAAPSVLDGADVTGVEGVEVYVTK